MSALGPIGVALRRVTQVADEHVLLQDLTLEVPSGGTFIVTGRNGTGKSTLLFVAAGLFPPQSGDVTIGGEPAGSLKASELFRRGIRRGFLFQEGGLISNMNSVSNVALALRYHADVLGLTESEIDQRAREALDRLHVSAADRQAFPAHLSYGERKCVGLARVIALRPNFLYFDEPLLGLDARTAALVSEVIMECQSSPGVTTLIATTNDEHLLSLEGAHYELDGGRLLPVPVPSTSPAPGSLQP
jgi:ABC-type transporter Mla maintaining outer membrane lipid asymmetry ATPase subunit MlaF